MKQSSKLFFKNSGPNLEISQFKQKPNRGKKKKKKKERKKKEPKCADQRVLALVLIRIKIGFDNSRVPDFESITVFCNRIKL